MLKPSYSKKYLSQSKFKWLYLRETGFLSLPGQVLIVLKKLLLVRFDILPDLKPRGNNRAIAPMGVGVPWLLHLSLLGLGSVGQLVPLVFLNAWGWYAKKFCRSLFVLSGKKLIIDHELPYFYSQRAEFRQRSSFDQYLWDLAGIQTSLGLTQRH